MLAYVYEEHFNLLIKHCSMVFQDTYTILLNLVYSSGYIYEILQYLSEYGNWFEWAVFFPSSSPRLSVDCFFFFTPSPQVPINGGGDWYIPICGVAPPSFFGGGGWYIPICGALLPLKIFLTKSTVIGTPKEASRLPRNPPDWILVVYKPSTCLRGSCYISFLFWSQEMTINHQLSGGIMKPTDCTLLPDIFLTICVAPSEAALANTLKPSVFANMDARVRFKLKILIKMLPPTCFLMFVLDKITFFQSFHNIWWYA